MKHRDRARLGGDRPVSARWTARVRAAAGDERGIAVALGLVTLLILTALVLSFLSVSAFEPRIAANLVGATQARYLAEAGIEAAFDGLANTADWNTALAGATCSTGAVAPGTAAASALPGLAAGTGTFTARVRNDCLAGNATVPGDRALTGLASEDGGGASTDTNQRLVIVSTGAVGTASRTVTAVVRKTSLPPINGALTFPGARASVDFAGSPVTITGTDTRMGTDAAGPDASVFGIAVAHAASLAVVKDAVAASPQLAVSGKSMTTSAAAGAQAVAHDASLGAAAVGQFVRALRGAADITISSAPASPHAIRDVGASCGTSIHSATCWGTPQQPKIVHVKGDGTGGHPALAIAGDSTGTGILLVEDGGLDITGTFRWNGPVIVSGRAVTVRFHGGDEHAIWGSLIVNETAPSSDVLVSGAAKIRYSAEAMRTVLDGLGGRRFMALYSWQEQ